MVTGESATEVRGEKAGAMGEDQVSDGQNEQAVDVTETARRTTSFGVMEESGSRVGTDISLVNLVTEDEEVQDQEGGEAENNPNDRALVVGTDIVPLAMIHPITPGPGNRTQIKVKQAREAEVREWLEAKGRKGRVSA